MQVAATALPTFEKKQRESSAGSVTGGAERRAHRECAERTAESARGAYECTTAGSARSVRQRGAKRERERERERSEIQKEQEKGKERDTE